MHAVNSYAIEYMTIMCIKINKGKYIKFYTVCLTIFIMHANICLLCSPLLRMISITFKIVSSFITLK